MLGAVREQDRELSAGADPRLVSGQQYIFNLSTKLGYTNPGSSSATSFAQGTWTFKIGLDDGTVQTVKVQLVK